MAATGGSVSGGGDALFEVGQRARVILPGKSRRCLVLCVGEEYDGSRSYDVLLVPPKHTQTRARGTSAATKICTAEDEDPAGSQEIPGLRGSDLSPLQSFELDGTLEEDNGGIPEDLGAEDLSVHAEALKDKGNVLFKLGDTEAAAEIFSKVLRALEPPPGVGTNVLVKNTPQGETAQVHFRSGMVSDVTELDDDSKSKGRPVSYDVIYDESDADGEDEEDGVVANRVVSVAVTSPCVSCAARLNLARCLFKVPLHSEVVDACTVVISLAKLLMVDTSRPREERLKLRGYCLTALRLRGGSHLAQNHIGLARKDAKNMARSTRDDDSAGRAQAARFEAEVEREAKALLKANRKLARDVSQWVNASMAKHEETSVAAAGGPENDSGDRGCGEGDLTSLPSRQQSGEQGEDSDDGGVEERKGFGTEEAVSGYGGGVRSWLGGWLG